MSAFTSKRLACTSLVLLTTFMARAQVVINTGVEECQEAGLFFDSTALKCVQCPATANNIQLVPAASSK